MDSNSTDNLKSGIQHKLLGRIGSFKELATDFKDVSTKTLREIILELEMDGVITRSVYAESLPPQARYSLSIRPKPIKGLFAKKKSFEQKNNVGKFDYISIGNEARARFKDIALENDGRITIFIRKYGKTDDEIIERTVSINHMLDDESGFIYIFGVPGPDYNYYSFSAYGLTWALSIEDFKSKLKRMHKITTWGTEYDYYIEDDSAD